MIDTDSYKNLMDALSRLFKHFPGSLTESGSDKGSKSASDLPEVPKGQSISIVTVGKDPHSGVKIPKLSAKEDKLNSGPIGSGKKGGKGD